MSGSNKKNKSSKLLPKQQQSKSDNALWDQVKQTITPLENREKFEIRVASTQKANSKKIVKKTALENRADLTTPSIKQALKTQQNLLKLQGTKTPGWQFQSPDDPNFSSLEKNIKRKLSRGQKPVEAVLDLHGMTQEQAHNRLKSFIHQCRKNGIRHVIVVTGKGKSAPDDPYRQRGAMGVLRKNLPIWLSSPDLKPAIVGYEQAPQHHGGAGAFYVHIRRLERYSI